MVRMSKPARRRHISRKRPNLPGKRGTSLQRPRKEQVNAVQGDQAVFAYIPKIS